MRKTNHEISKLIQFGYDLHKGKMDDYDYSTMQVPNCTFYSGSYYPMEEVKQGGIFGCRLYTSHSTSEVFTQLGITVGKFEDGNFEFDYALIFQVSNENDDIYINNLCLKDDSQEDKILDYDKEFTLEKMTKKQQLKKIIKVMEVVGYKKEDILKVIQGKMLARDAYMNVAPKEIKYRQWVNKARRYYEFDKNVAISGDFSGVCIDEFPFPFEGTVILDCSKVKTTSIKLQYNFRRIKLIHINENRNSIMYSNLKNAIIDEVIDLSKVDASDTIFGHHVVINVDKSIADIENINLTLATNENGDRFVVNDKGVVQLDSKGKPLILSKDNLQHGKVNQVSKENLISNIQVFANVDNKDSAEKAIHQNADGVGLVRTEYIINQIEDIEKLMEYLFRMKDTKFLNQLKESQQKQALDILKNVDGNKVVFRLFDFKVMEYFKYNVITEQFWNYYDDEIDELRGVKLLIKYPDILKIQLEAFFEVAIKKGIKLNLLVPMIERMYEFTQVKEIIHEVAGNYQFKKFKIGAMVENKRMANDADLIASEADFITFGTNDLTESVTKLSRDTHSVEFSKLSTEVKEIIKESVYRARISNPQIPIGFCGDHTNYIENTAFYYEVGASYISCHPSFVIPIKELLVNIECNKNETNKRLVLCSKSKK